MKGEKDEKWQDGDGWENGELAENGVQWGSYLGKEGGTEREETHPVVHS